MLLTLYSTVANPPTSLWSQCSYDARTDTLEKKNLDVCLKNIPETLHDDPFMSCGNYFIDEGKTTLYKLIMMFHTMLLPFIALQFHLNLCIGAFCTGFPLFFQLCVVACCRLFCYVMFSEGMY